MKVSSIIKNPVARKVVSSAMLVGATLGVTTNVLANNNKIQTQNVVRSEFVNKDATRVLRANALYSSSVKTPVPNEHLNKLIVAKDSSYADATKDIYNQAGTMGGAGFVANVLYKMQAVDIIEMYQKIAILANRDDNYQDKYMSFDELSNRLTALYKWAEDYFETRRHEIAVLFNNNASPIQFLDAIDKSVDDSGSDFIKQTYYGNKSVVTNRSKLNDEKYVSNLLAHKMLIRDMAFLMHAINESKIVKNSDAQKIISENGYAITDLFFVPLVNRNFITNK